MRLAASLACLVLFAASTACAPSGERSGGSALVPGITKDKPENDSASKAYLFAASNNRHDHRGFISVYLLGSKTPIATIIPPSVDVPNDLLTDSAGDLYVADNRTGPAPSGGAVVEYAPDGSKIVRRITEGVHNPDCIKLDSAGNLYVANYSTNTVTVYSAGSKQILRTITDRVSNPSDLEFDPAGDLFVVNEPLHSGGSVTEYAPQSRKLIGRITNGIQYPSTIAFGPSGKKIYVSNVGGKSITVYDAASFRLLQTITAGFKYPIRVAVDAAGNLYVLDTDYNIYGAIFIFADGGKSPMRTITKGMHVPESMILDASGDVYVGNLKKCNIYNGRCNRGSVSIYKHDEGHLWYQIKDGLDGVTALAIASPM